MTVTEIGERCGVVVCTGNCGLSVAAHREGRVCMGVVHFAARRFSRRSARNLLLLITRMLREGDDEYLNSSMYDWMYEYLDAVSAWKISQRLGFAIPGRLFDQNRVNCILMAQRRGVRLARDYPAIYQWSKAGREYLTPVTIEDRFWAKVAKSDGCWEWQGARLPSGYGKMQIRSQGRNMSVHRLSWEIHNGPIPAGLLVCHTCDNPPCVRPDHLFLGTARENVADSISKGRFRPGGRTMAPR